jgi:diadenosine tetraphosphatase ApaH/serine/threonine PP2A family protein phosphatase
MLGLVRTLFLSDIHANREALDAVLEHAARQATDRVIFLGDAVGYGPDPGHVLDVLADLAAECVIGNHDRWLLDLLDGAEPHSYGIVGVVLEWQLTELQNRHIEQLQSWPERRVYEPRTLSTDREGMPLKSSIGFEVVHGSPRELFEYIDGVPVARNVFAEWPGRLVFVGHTHLPGVYATLEGPSGDWVKHNPARDDKSRFPLPPKARWIVNPGSVGQPRDGVARASYAIFDDEKGILEIFRVSYDFGPTQAKLRRAGLPEALAARLSVGR